MHERSVDRKVQNMKRSWKTAEERESKDAYDIFFFSCKGKKERP